MITQRILPWTWIAVLAALLLPGCGRKDPAANSGQSASAGGADASSVQYDKLGRDRETYVRYLPANPDNLNPTIRRDVYSHYMIEYIFDPLYHYDNENNYVLKPVLAEALPEISEDHKTFTIRLRKEAKWHDGVPVTADDVVFGWELTVNPEVDSGQKKSYYDDVEKIEKVDDHTVRIVWKKPYAFYANVLTMDSIMPKHVFKGVSPRDIGKFKYPEGHMWAGTSYSIRPIGCGPYTVEKFEPQKEVILLRNENYWGKKPEIKRVHCLIITDTLASRQYLKRGDLDAFNYNVARQWKEDQDNAFIKRNYNLTYYYRAVYYYMGWNTQREFFQDKRVRQAMARLCDIDSIIKQVELGYATRCIGPYSAEFSQADRSIKPIPFDPTAAKALLDESGWKDTDGDGIRDRNGMKFAFELLMPSKNPRFEAITTIFQEQLKKSGILMTIRSLEWNAFSEEVHNQKFDAMASGWASSDPEDDAYQIWHSSQSKDRGSNYVSYHNPRVDELLMSARLEFDRAKRDAMCQEINRLIYEDQPYCFVMHPQLISVVHKRFVTGKPSPLMGYDPRAGYDFKIVGSER